MKVKLLIGDIGSQVLVDRDLSLTGFCSYAKLVPCCVNDPVKNEIRYEIRQYAKDKFFDDHDTDIVYTGSTPGINLSDEHFIISDIIEIKYYDKILKALFGNDIDDSIIKEALSDYTTFSLYESNATTEHHNNQELHSLTNEIICLKMKTENSTNGMYTLPSLIDLLFNRLKIDSLRLTMRENEISIRIITISGRSLQTTIEAEIENIPSNNV